MLRNLEHNRVCHENIVILNLEIQRTPRQDVVSRSYPEEILPGIHVVHARFGFMETPDVAVALAGAARRGLRIDDGLHVLPRLAPGARPRAARHRRHEDAALCLDAAAQRPGGGVLPHADAARRRACDRSRGLGRDRLDRIALLHAEPDRPRRTRRRQRDFRPERRAHRLARGIVAVLRE